MAFLIDGYNLLYAMGVLRGRTGPAGLLQARRRLLGLLRAVHGDEASAVTVVFDAAGAPPGAVEVKDFQGIQVRFAVREDEADDLIETLIRQDAVPRQLTVVSDDHRIQQAARRRRCVVLGCQEYLDWLDRHRRARRRPAPDAADPKPAGSSAEETRRWLQEFADLENDPAWKEFADLYDFDLGDPESP